MTTPTGPQVGPWLRAWYRWKTLRLPWRRQFLVGLDLQGNTYWTFRIAGTTESDRWRRIVKYPTSVHHSDVKVQPQWHQWLRYRRETPPSLAEQAQEVVRQQQIKLLAAEADARWEAKPRVMDIPETERRHLKQPAPALDTGGADQEARDGAGEASCAGAGEYTRQSKQKQPKEDPWKRAASGPSETWQPEAWSPTSVRKR